MLLQRRVFLFLIVFFALPVRAGASDHTAPQKPHRGFLSHTLNPLFADGNSLEDSDSTAAYNLRPLAFPGWFLPAVPRAGGGATARNVMPTATLPGNQPTTWLNYGIDLFGSEFVARLEYRVGVDDLFELSTIRTGRLFPGQYLSLNAGPVTVPGGRHTVIVRADPEDRIEEAEEEDNVWMGQFVWSPLPLLPGVPAVRPMPPAPGLFFEPNCDGFVLTVPFATAWVVAEAASDPLDDYDLYLYEDYSGSTSGFEIRRAASFSSQNGTDFVVGHRNGSLAAVYPGVARFAGTNRSNCVVDAAVSTGRATTDLEATWALQEMATNRLAEVYEGFFYQGFHYRLYLVRNSGEDDISFNVYPPEEGGIYGRNDQAQVALGDEFADVIEFDVTQSGWHPVVVYRTSGTRADKPLVYSFYWTTGVAGAPEDGGPPITAARAFPNPMRDQTQVTFPLSAPGPLRVNVYDVRGRCIRTIEEHATAAGGILVRWDGRSTDGLEAPAGLYWLRLTSAGSPGGAVQVVKREK